MCFVVFLCVFLCVVVPPPTVVGGEHNVVQSSVCPVSIRLLSVNTYFALCDISVLSGGILMKLGAENYHVIGNC